MAQVSDLRKKNKSGQTKLESIKAWLKSHGAEVLVPTSEWEVLRFRDGDGVHVIYRNKRQTLTMQGKADMCWRAFHSKSKWRPKPIKAKTKSRNLRPQLQAVIKRDGDNCWLCGRKLGRDVSPEHLVPRVFGGPNHIANIVATHSACNRMAGHLSVAEKVRLREKMHKQASSDDFDELVSRYERRKDERKSADDRADCGTDGSAKRPNGFPATRRVSLETGARRLASITRVSPNGA